MATIAWGHEGDWCRVSCQGFWESQDVTGCLEVFAQCPPLSGAIGALSKGLGEVLPPCWNNSSSGASQPHGHLL